MKKKLLVKRIFSIIIAIALLVSAVPISLAVQNLFIEETTPKIVREVTELREESVKHFLCEDGSYIAATYSAPVHYKENGEWKEIDNSLSLDRSTLSESGKPTYTTKAGGLSVSIPQNFSDGQKITAQNKGYEIGFGINANQNDASLKTSASVVEIESLSSNTDVVMSDTVKRINNVTTASTLDSNDIEAYNAELMTVDNQSSAVTYKEIMPDTDFEYIVTSNSIKENIVVYEPQDEYTYSFDMDFDGLTPIVNPDNSISLVEPSNPDETIFFIEAPYMYDSNNEESIDIEMLLVANGDKYVMTLVANAEWINNPERTFPIVIDPTIQSLNSSINDVFVINGLYANSARIKDRLRIGRNLTNLTRTYIKIAVPDNVPEGSIVNSATLTLKKDNYYQALLADDISVKVYDCCNVNSWDMNTISWNNQPFNNSNNGYASTSGAVYLSSTSANSNKDSYSFDITAAVQRWVNKETNNGIMIASSDESTKTQVDFHSSRVSNESNRPAISLNYIPSGIEQSSWSADSESSTSSEINITTSKEWIATTNQSWLTVSPASGSGSSTFSVSATENTSTNERTGIVVVTSGNTVIGTLNVTQLGAVPTLIVDQSDFKIDSKGRTVEVEVTSNVGWTYSSSNEQMLYDINRADNDNSLLTETLSISIGENVYNEETASGGETRIATITLQDTDGYDLSTVITITQYDAVTERFLDIEEDGTVTTRSSSEYNHALATWSMALSYAAYNPIEYQALPFIPSGFMQEPYNDETKTAEAELESLGFDATSYNYDGGYLGYAAHTIGHRKITVNNIGDDNNDINGTNAFVDDTNSLSFSSFSVLESDSGIYYGDYTGSVDSVTEETISESESTSRTLIVISVRGSVTPLDWVMDLNNQINWEILNFETGCQEVIASLNSYLSSNDEIEDNPIILVTGHSLGAAIANLVAHELNNGISSPDVYAYTFATPNTVNGANNNPISYTNIFNFLNNNDFVPHFPVDFLENVWARHGQDFHITMPLDIDWIIGVDYAMLGLAGHGMPNYYSWITNLPETLNIDDKDITVEDLEMLSEDIAIGLLPKLLKAKCPVSVTLYNSNGNIVAYESQQEGVIYPETTDIGIVSWISENGEKMFLIPYGSEAIDVHIEAYDYGTMNLTVEQPGVGEPINTVTFNNVNLYPNKEFLVEVSEDTLPEDTQLFVTENGEIVGEVTETEPHFKNVIIEHVEKNGQIVTYKTFVTDNTVTEVRFHDRSTNGTYYLTPNSSIVSIVEDGDNLMWTAGYVYNTAGDYSYDVSVKSGEEWYYYENVFSVHIPQEYIDYQENAALETNSINATTETTPVVII